MTPPTVLFVCVHNAGRSQMAAGFPTAVAGDRVEVLSAGSAPRDGLNPVAVGAMAEVGIDIRAAIRARGAARHPQNAADQSHNPCAGQLPFLA